MNDNIDNYETSEQGTTPGDANKNLSGALDAALQDLNRTIEHMEAAVARLKAGDDDWQESIRLIGEANELAIASSQTLDRLIQDVTYGSGDRGAFGGAQQDSGQQSLELS